MKLQQKRGGNKLTIIILIGLLLVTISSVAILYSKDSITRINSVNNENKIYHASNRLLSKNNQYLETYGTGETQQPGLDGVIYAYGSNSKSTKITEIEQKRVKSVQKKALTKYLDVWEDNRETFLAIIVFIELILAGITYLAMKKSRNKKTKRILGIALIIILLLGFLTAGILRMISSSIR